METIGFHSGPLISGNADVPIDVCSVHLKLLLQFILHLANSLISKPKVKALRLPCCDIENSPTAGLQQTVPDLQRRHAEVCYPDVVLLV